MTPEERAAAVVQNYHAARCWGYDPVQHTEYEKLIADQIREAVATDREQIKDRLVALARRLTLAADEHYRGHDHGGSLRLLIERDGVLSAVAEVREGCE